MTIFCCAVTSIIKIIDLAPPDIVESSAATDIGVQTIELRVRHGGSWHAGPNHIQVDDLRDVNESAITSESSMCKMKGTRGSGLVIEESLPFIYQKNIRDLHWGRPTNVVYHT
jgi:hypothetical protein